MTAPIKAWSFSLLKDFEACPYRVYLSRVAKVPQPPVEDPAHPLIRGNRIHAEAEAFIKGEGPMTHDLRRADELLEDLSTKYQEGLVEVEERWGFTRQWEPVDWSANDVWCRIICDVVEHTPDASTAWIRDWKTGKSFGNEVKHQQQMQLYGLAAMIRYPKLILSRSSMEYLDEGKQKVSSYTRDVLPTLLARWEARAEKLTSAIVFPAKPNRGNCRFCPFGIEVGTGDCAYAVSKER